MSGLTQRKGELGLKILHLDASVTGQKSISRPLTKDAAKHLKELYPEAIYVYRDLVAQPLGQSTAVRRRLDADGQNPAVDQIEEFETSKQILSEFLSADTILIGAPMYNYGIPSQLKVWIDLICVPGVTFTYGPTGAKGQCGDKRVIVIATRGGRYGPGSPTESRDHQEKYLRDIFGHLGVTNITVITVEGVALGPESLEKALGAARAGITGLM